MIEQLEDWQEIRVRWRDAHSPHSGWHEVEEYTPDSANACTLGRYWRNCQEGYLTVVGTIFEEDGKVKTVGDINHIPIGWITSIDIIPTRSDHADTQEI